MPERRPCVNRGTVSAELKYRLFSRCTAARSSFGWSDCKQHSLLLLRVKNEYCQNMKNSEIAVSFLEMASSGAVREAYEKFIHPSFTHHNVYFPGDRASLFHGMEESAGRFPDKKLEVVRTIEEADLVAVHGKVRLKPDGPAIALIHIFRVLDGKIIEEWEAGQEVPSDSPNVNGAF